MYFTVHSAIFRAVCYVIVNPASRKVNVEKLCNPATNSVDDEFRSQTRDPQSAIKFRKISKAYRKTVEYYFTLRQGRLLQYL